MEQRTLKSDNNNRQFWIKRMKITTWVHIIQSSGIDTLHSIMRSDLYMLC